MRLGLLDLVAPHFLIDFRLPDQIHDIVAFLRVSELETAWDETGIVYAGKAVFDGTAAASPTPLQKQPSGALFEWNDVNVQFRMTVARDGSPDLKQVIDKAAAVGGGKPIANLKATVDRFGSVPATGVSSDYPGFAFRLELLLSAITLHLPKKTFVPARLAADGRLEPDPNLDDVRIRLPKVAVVVTRANKPLSADADFEGWGITGLDDNLDSAAGEMISMQPPLALHESGVFGFGLEKAVLDLSADHTPSEILEQFGTGDDFKGLWLPHVRVFLAPKGATGLAFDLRANDLLIDFQHGLSGELAFEVINHIDGKLQVEPRFFEGERMILPVRGYKLPGDPRATTIRGSRASVAADGELQLAITGGHAPYTITVTRKDDNHEIPATPYAPPGAPPAPPVPPDGVPLKRVVWPLKGTSVGRANFNIHVVDSSAPGKVCVFDENLEVEVRPEGNRIGTTTILPAPTLDDINGTGGYTLALSDSQPDPGAVILRASPAPLQSVAVTGANVTPTAAGEVRVPVTDGGPAVAVTATWPAAVAAPLEARFGPDSPSDGEFDSEVERVATAQAAALHDLITRAASKPIAIEARAAYDGDPSSAAYKQALSEQRAQVLKAAIVRVQKGSGLPAATFTTQGKGFDEARNVFDFARPSYVPEAFDNAIATPQPATAAPQRSVSVKRAAAVEVPLIVPTERGPAPLEPERPAFFRKIGVRVRLERNKLVLFEIFGEVDFKTAAEERAAVIKSSASDHQPVADQSGSGLSVKAQPGASQDPKNQANPGDGIVDYRLTVSYDTATGKLSEEIAFGSGEDDRDGLVHIENSTPPGAIGNVAGALLVFAPLLAKSIDSAVTPGGGSAAVPLALGAAEIGAAATLGLTGGVKMQRITWFGAELSAKQTLATTKTFDEVALLLDYAVDFFVAINVGPLHINSKTTTPLRVRYKALGFKLAFGKGKAFSPVFDTSRGYQLDLADPGLFEVSSPFGDIIKILAARVAKTNPFVIEFDLGMKVNLGVITVESIRVTWPLDPLGPPTILPTGISVNVPGVITGKGFIDLRGGFKGSLDLSLVPLKLRMAGAVAIQPMAPPLVPDGRKVTAIYVGLRIEFPTAIPIGGSGIGLYGILGLFAMHFKRSENKAADIPALDWLDSVDGDPTGTSGDPPALTGWVADVDRWAFGVGAVLGTLGSGTVLNLKGMLVVELPGPRILLFVKLQILTPQPPTKGDVKELGILAVVDLDFELRQFTIGVAINYDIENILSLTLPVKARFNLDVGKDWEVNLGKISQPASAKILNIVKASGYLMFAGDKIEGFPHPPGPPSGVLPGFAIAAGVRASVVFGDESINLFLKVSASFDAALVFSPFHVYGLMELKGQLHLFIISLSASATLQVDAPSPTILDGKACASLDLFFFTLEGCVEIHIGPDEGAVLEPPPLIAGMALQSRSPALTQGQGTDRPVDAKLCDAAAVEAVDIDKNGPVLKDLPRVPIDVVPILKMHAAPDETGCATFTTAIGKAPNQAMGAWMDQGGGRSVRYVLKSLAIDPPIPPSQEGLPPATWRATGKLPGGQDTEIDLALFSWEPVSDPRAFQRSRELTDRVRIRWEGVCTPVAPPARALWTFNRQPLGARSGGWQLTGTALPDPEGLLRSTPVDVQLLVRAPVFDPILAALQGDAGKGNLETARVVGFDGRVGGAFRTFSIAQAGRALQLPFVHRREKPPQPPPPPKIVADGADTATASHPTVADAAADAAVTVAAVQPARQTLAVDPLPGRISIECGPCKEARLFIAEHVGLKPAQVVLRAFNAAGVLLKTDSEATLPVAFITQRSHLPAEWVDVPGIGQDVNDVFDIFEQLDARPGTSLGYRLISYPIPAGAMRFELAADVPIGFKLPVLYLGAVELLRGSELDRASHDESIRSSDIKTVENAMNAGRLRPLLARDTRYTISASYVAEVRQEDKKKPGTFKTTAVNRTQRFAFVTDDKPPERLNPWVLATTPSPDEPAHFANDPLRIVFNDASGVQLFNAYGKLRAVVRQSNGDHPKDKPVLGAENLSRLAARILSPFEETLRRTIRDAEMNACVHVSESEAHRMFEVDADLLRKSSYTLDIEFEDLPSISAEPRVPLFRVAFTTSRFTSAQELASVVRAGKVKHRTLKGVSGDDPLAGLPAVPSDIQMEDALSKAGLEPQPGAAQPGVTLLWRPAGDDFVLFAAMLDAPEALWRTRAEPKEVTEQGDNGFMKHYVDSPREWLFVGESGSAAVKQFIRSAGGTRGLFLLNPGAKAINLSLRQLEHTLIDEKKQTDWVLFSATLPTVAPWRSDDA